MRSSKATFNFNKVSITFINANLMHFICLGWEEVENNTNDGKSLCQDKISISENRVGSCIDAS